MAEEESSEVEPSTVSWVAPPREPSAGTSSFAKPLTYSMCGIHSSMVMKPVVLGY